MVDESSQVETPWKGSILAFGSDIGRDEPVSALVYTSTSTPSPVKNKKATESISKVKEPSVKMSRAKSTMAKAAKGKAAKAEEEKAKEVKAKETRLKAKAEAKAKLMKAKAKAARVLRAKMSNTQYHQFRMGERNVRKSIRTNHLKRSPRGFLKVAQIFA